MGNLVQYLQFLEKEGIPRKDILDNYVFFTAGSCGPCRFGMYEAEYRFALKNAGFDGFRVLLFKDSDGIKAASGELGSKFTVDFGFGMLNAMHMGDVFNDLIYQIRPFEVNKGETDRIFRETVDDLCDDLKNRKSFEIEQSAPDWAKPKFKSNKILRNTFNVFGKMHEHLWGEDYLDALAAARAKMDKIEVDRTKVKPVVKITGEFWAQLTEGDGNFNMFNFLEREGAQVLVEPIATWVAYLMYQAKAHAKAKYPVTRPYRSPKWYQLKQHMANQMSLRKKLMGIAVGEKMWNYLYHRTAEIWVASRITSYRNQSSPKWRTRSTTSSRGAGRAPRSRQERVLYGAQALPHGARAQALRLHALVAIGWRAIRGYQQVQRYDFPARRNSGEGEVNAHRRVQMALGEAKVKAKLEFEETLKSTGKSLDDIKSYIAEHPELKRPFYHVPHVEGVTGTAAQFVLHVSDRMNRSHRSWRRSRSQGITVPSAA